MITRRISYSTRTVAGSRVLTLPAPRTALTRCLVVTLARARVVSARSLEPSAPRQGLGSFGQLEQSDESDADVIDNKNHTGIVARLPGGRGCLLDG